LAASRASVNEAWRRCTHRCGYGKHTQIVVDRYPNATVELWRECGHLPWLDAPARFESQLTSFYHA